MASIRERLEKWVSMDRGLGVSMVLLAVVVVVDLRNSPHLVFWERHGPGPSFLPMVLALIFAGLAMPLLFSKRSAHGAGIEASTANTIKYIVLVALLAWLFPVVGGLITMGLFVLAETLWVERYRLRTSIIAATVTIGTVWIIFVWLLGVRLPIGPFGI